MRAIARRNYVIERMVENGYVSRKDGDAAKAEPLTSTRACCRPTPDGRRLFAEEVRRELNDRYGDKKLYEGGLSVRATLDPKMQLMARKALVDGPRALRRGAWLARRRCARSTSPAIGGRRSAEVPALGDVAPWRLAVVLDANDNAARIGLQPPHEKSGDLGSERETGTLTAEGVRWTHKRLRQVVSPGDVVYVEPIDGHPGQFRLRQIPEISGAIVAMDPYTGRVFAMVGGFSFDQSEFNRSTQALRQPGSSFKPFVYATALDNGYTPSSIVLDEPIEIDQANGEVWRPENFEEGHYGPHTLRYGIEHSNNLMTVRLARDIGMPLIAEYARRFGIYDNMPPYLRWRSARAKPRSCAWSPPIPCWPMAASASSRR